MAKRIAVKVTRRQRRRAAYHEAGHAVICRARGCALRRMTIVPEGDTIGYTVAGTRGRGRRADRKRVAIALGGVVAETMAFGRLSDDDIDGARTDLANAHRLFRRLGFKKRPAMKRECDRLCFRICDELEARWPAVEAIASELLEREHFSGKEARRIIREALAA